MLAEGLNTFLSVEQSEQGSLRHSWTEQQCRGHKAATESSWQINSREQPKLHAFTPLSLPFLDIV